MWIVGFVDSGMCGWWDVLMILGPTLPWKRLYTCYSSIQAVFKLLYIFEVMYCSYTFVACYQ